MTAKTISINRAPVLTLWAAVVAERLGFDEHRVLIGEGEEAAAVGRRGCPVCGFADWVVVAEVPRLPEGTSRDAATAVGFDTS